MMLEMLAPLHPHRSASELKLLAMGVNTTIEGMHVTFGLGRQMLEQSPEMEELLFRQIMRSIDSGLCNA